MQSERKKIKLKNREKYNSFGDYLLNGEDVIPVLMTMAKWSGIFISILMLWAGFGRDIGFLKVIGVLFFLASARSLYKFYKFGGAKTLYGTNPGEWIYGKKYRVKVKKKWE